jgi:putative alpha-1,2-mannosidase
LMALGLFSVQGNAAVDPVYEITSPVFDTVTISLDPKYYSGRQFVITTHNNSDENVYIQRATLNGKAHEQFWIRHADYAQGGHLDLWLGKEPNKNWGTAPAK